MKKVIFLLLTCLFTAHMPCMAIDHSAEQLLSFIKLSPHAATQSDVTSVLGKPKKVEEGKKRTLWYYDHDNVRLIISWNKKSLQLEKFSFNNALPEKNVFD